MRFRTISIIMFSITTVFLSWNSSIADEVVICINQEQSYAVLMDVKGQCLDEEIEFVTSGTKIKRTEDVLPIAIFSENKHCEKGSSGTTTQVGFDKNDDGALSADEILGTSGWCSSSDQSDV